MVVMEESMKKKVAILLPWLKMGGTNKIAVNFMAELAEYCDVTLILSQNIGELLPDLPENVHLIIDEMSSFKNILKDDLKHIKVKYLLKDFLYYAKIKIGRDNIDNYKYIVERHSYICDTQFDCAISYHGQSPERLLNLIYRTHAKKKVAWIHGEVSFSKDKCQRLQKYYQEMDRFFFVSNHTMQSFQKTIGFDKKKGTVYYNPINKKEILEKAEMPMEVVFDSGIFNILTVGRVSAEKGQDMIPEIVRRLLDQGMNICWYIIGDGDNLPKIQELIEKYKVENSVKLLGVKTNPYCYMKSCDLYVQPSYTEGYSTTICEAGMLGKAIIGTKPSGGIRNQITDGKDGMIVDATIEGLTHGIRQLIFDKTLKHQFERNILKKNFDGKGEIQKFLKYINE